MLMILFCLVVPYRNIIKFYTPETNLSQNCLRLIQENFTDIALGYALCDISHLGAI